MSVDAYIAVGSNLGDRRAAIALAVRSFDEAEGFAVRALSPIVETEPVGPEGQGKYLNAVVHVRTIRAARDVLAHCLATEARAGRVRRERWGPRSLDLDLLLYGDAVIDEPGLTVPHPRLHERAFVLEPFARMAPHLVHPLLGRTIEELRRRVTKEPAGPRAGAEKAT
jgi:2-amino-4-hydroxy-6-hydroxymethyldihydropteridine diphosphokinase